MPDYCYGKGGVCNTPCAGESCEHYDETGGRVATVGDMIRSMSNERLAETVYDLYLRLQDPEFDLSELWCNPDMHGLCTGSQTDRILFCNTQERKKCILCWLNSPAEEVR